MPNGFHQCLVVPPEVQRADDLRHFVLEFHGLALQYGVVLPFVVSRLEAFFQAGQSAFEGGAFLSTLTQNVPDAAHLLCVRDVLCEDDLPDIFQRVAHRLPDIYDQRAHVTAMIGAFPVVFVAMFPLADVPRVLRGDQQSIDQKVVEVEILVGDEAEEVKMPFRIGPSGYLEHFRLDHRMGVVPEANPASGRGNGWFSAEAGTDRIGSAGRRGFPGSSMASLNGRSS